MNQNEDYLLINNYFLWKIINQKLQKSKITLNLIIEKKLKVFTNEKCIEAACAKFENYIINIKEDSSVEVLKNGAKYSNTISELRSISKKVNFAYEEGWNTRQFGKKLVEFLSTTRLKYVESELVKICADYQDDEAHFTDKQEIDKKINDIKNYPHLFVLACLMDRQIKAERAWEIPYCICRDLCNNDFSFNAHLKLLSNEKKIIDYYTLKIMR